MSEALVRELPPAFERGAPAAGASAWRSALHIAALGGLYFSSAWLALTFFSPIHPLVAAVWPPSGVALAGLLLLGPRAWPGIYLGAFAINAMTLGAVAPALVIGLGNTLGALAASSLVERFAGGREAFTQARRMLGFAGLVTVAMSISATAGVGTLILGGYAPASSLAGLWSTWWLGDSAGAILITPLLILWHRERGWGENGTRLLEAAALLCAAGIIGLVAFMQPSLGAYPPAFLFLPLLGWAALRFGTREVATVVALLSMIAAWGTAAGYGPFVRASPNASLLVLQAFMILMALCSLPVAALMEERSALLQRERSARAEAEAASASKDEFLAMVAHELRNPLAAIRAAAEVLLRSGASGEEAARWHRSISRQTEHISRLMDDLLDVGRIATGKLVMKCEPLDLGAAVTRCQHTLAAVDFVPQRRPVEIDAPPLWIWGDPSRIHQIVTNLVGNALKYTPPEERIRVRVYREGDEAVLRVEDSGIGISRHLLPRIFDLFTQDEQGLERSRGGLGIGLTLVRRLSELHGGQVYAHSEGPGRGSTFIVRFPAIDPPAQTRDTEAVAAPATRRQRILLIEDDADGREAMLALLTILGHEVRAAADGEAGLETALQFEYDLALVDIGLPGLDGYEVAERLRAARPRAPIVALTGYAADDDEQRSREAGLTGHLVKPVGLDALRRVMGELLA